MKRTCHPIKSSFWKSFPIRRLRRRQRADDDDDFSLEWLSFIKRILQKWKAHLIKMHFQYRNQFQRISWGSQAKSFNPPYSPLFLPLIVVLDGESFSIQIPNWMSSSFISIEIEHLFENNKIYSSCLRASFETTIVFLHHAMPPTASFSFSSSHEMWWINER